jgi:oligopeptide transport system ATP-binding protein
MKSKKVEISVKDLTISFRTNQGFVQAVRGISFDLYKGETLAIVGESGSGKSVSSRAIVGILPGNGIIEKGSIIYEDQDLTKIKEEQFHKIRGNKIGMIFQDPMSSLNPIMRIGSQITESMLINGKHMKNRYKELFHSAYTNVLNTKEEIKKLNSIKTESDEKKSDKLTKLKHDLVKFKAELKLKKIDAKETVNKEFLREKASADEKISKLKSEIANLKIKLNGAKSLSKNEDKISKLKKDISNLYLEISSVKENLNRFVQVTKKEAYERAIQIMTEVGIPEPEKRFRMYPFQFSGGMRQRIVIAIALTANPEVLICDEPTTALDVTIQAQILELIKRLKEERQLSVIFITHDLGVVANVSDRVAVMYAGKIVEYGNLDEIFYNPKHPYTWALLSSIPDIDSAERLTSIPGTPPNMLFPPVGDAFAERNQYAMEIDFKEQPPMFKVNDEHYAASWLLHPDAPKVQPPQIVVNRIKNMKRLSKEMLKNGK